MLVYANVEFDDQYGSLYRIVGRNLYVPEEKLYEHALNHAKEDTYAIGLTLSDFQHVIDVVLYNEERFKALRYNELPLKYVGEVDLVPQSVEVEGTWPSNVEGEDIVHQSSIEDCQR